jgi:hypothetical protein
MANIWLFKWDEERAERLAAAFAERYKFRPCDPDLDPNIRDRSRRIWGDHSLTALGG